MGSTVDQGCLTVIVIDDNRDHRELITGLASRLLADWIDVRTCAFATPGEALAELPAGGDTIILMDYQFGQSTGLDWLGDFVRADSGPVILVTSSGDEEIACEAFRRGASDYICKSAILDDPSRLARMIREVLHRHQVDRINRDLAYRLKTANAELARKNEILADLTDTAHRFVDDVAHEFRTPLAVIKEFTSIISDGIGGEVTETQSEYLGYVLDATRDLALLVDDFLDSGRLRAQTLRVDRDAHDVSTLLDGIWPVLASRAGAKGVTLERQIASDIPLVFADADKVRRSLVNLVVNAIKFSGPDDTVTISARLTQDRCVAIDVADEGPGLSADEELALFERFRQGGSGHRISTKGFGLGLNIVKELSAINLGTVSVGSELGAGSTFTITLPAAEVIPIVESFVRRTMERNSEAVVTLLRISRSGSESDELRSAVAALCHATDLILCSPDGRSLIVAGETHEAEAWAARILSLDADARKHTPRDSIPPLSIEALGSWSASESLRHLLAQVELRQERRIA